MILGAGAKATGEAGRPWCAPFRMAIPIRAKGSTFRYVVFLKTQALRTRPEFPDAVAASNN
jgi:hypothetical protein